MDHIAQPMPVAAQGHAGRGGWIKGYKPWCRTCGWIGAYVPGKRGDGYMKAVAACKAHQEEAD